MLLSGYKGGNIGMITSHRPFLTASFTVSTCEFTVLLSTRTATHKIMMEKKLHISAKALGFLSFSKWAPKHTFLHLKSLSLAVVH
jgi:hypothetical protein